MHDGLIEATRSAATCVFGRPIAPIVAIICRLRFVGSTVSESTRSSAPTPLRASASTA